MANDFVPSSSMGWIVYGWIFLIYQAFFLPILVYYLYFYIKNKDKPYIRPRMADATIVLAVLVLVTIMFRIIDGLIGMGYIPYFWMDTLLRHLHTIPTLVVFVYKFWFTFYHYRKNEIIADQGWTVLLLLGRADTHAVRKYSVKHNKDENNQNHNDFESHWTIKYSNTLGNKKWFAVVISIIGGVLNITVIVLLFINKFKFNEQDKYDWMLTTAVWLNLFGLLVGGIIIPIIAIIKVNRFTDMIDIKHEILGYAITVLILVFLLGTFDIYNTAINPQQDGVRKIYLFGIISCASTVYIYQGLIRILHKLDPTISIIYQIKHILFKSNFNPLNNIKPRIAINSQTPNGITIGDRYKLKDIIGHEMGYRLLMRYLVDEYSTENLLFYTEIIQFKYKSDYFKDIIEKINQNSNDKNNNNNNNTFKFPYLPSNIPQSNIMKEKNIFNKIAMITDRYIIDSAQLQINISSINRKRLFEKMKKLAELNINSKKKHDYINDSGNYKDDGDDMDREWLFTFFDDACKEIFLLLKTSFRNFNKTANYAKWVQEFKIDADKSDKV